MGLLYNVSEQEDHLFWYGWYTVLAKIYREVFYLVLVAVLIGIMISIVVGVSLVPTILTATAASATTDPLYGAPDGIISLVGVLPYVFVAVILLGAVAWIGGQG